MIGDFGGTHVWLLSKEKELFFFNRPETTAVPGNPSINPYSPDPAWYLV